MADGFTGRRRRRPIEALGADRVRLLGSHAREIDGYEVRVESDRLTIILKRHAAWVATIFFRFDGLTTPAKIWPAGARWPAPRSGVLWELPLSTFSPILDLLRNENPIRIAVDTRQDPIAVTLLADHEPVGEGEEDSSNG